MKHYYHPMSRGVSTDWILHELDLEQVVVDYMKDENYTSEFRAINPMGKLPVLVDGDVVITEAAAICAYLADKYIDGSHDIVESYIKQHMPTVGYTRNEGTFMTFLDFSKTMKSVGASAQYKSHGKESPEHYFQDWMVHNSGVYLNPGSVHGVGGAGHMRMNIASS